MLLPGYCDYIRPFVAKASYHLRPRKPWVMYYRDDEGALVPWMDCEWTLKPESVDMLLDAYKQYAEKEQWYNDARRQLFVADAKKEIKKTEPQVFEKKMVALTICPPPEYATVEHVQKIMDIVKKVSAIKGGCYVYEQRSVQGEEEYGWHIHLSVDTTYAPSKVKQFVYQMMESRGYKFNRKVAYLATPDDGGFRNKYMQGEKNHADKDPKVAKDRILREKYSLEHVYMF